MRNKLARGFEGHLKANRHQKKLPVPSSAEEERLDPSLKDLMEQFAGVTVAQPKLEKKVQLLTKNQVTEKENRACAGGLRDPAAFVRSSEKARTAGARLRRCLDEVLRQPDVLEAMLGVVETLGTEECTVPEAAVAKARQALCREYGVTLDEDLGRGSSGDVRSRYFSNLWEKLLTEAADPESKDLSKSVVEWMRTGAPIGWRKELHTCGVFPQTWEDTAAVEKSKLYDSESLEAPFANYRSFFEAGEHAEAEVKRIHEAGFTRAYRSLGELK